MRVLVVEDDAATSASIELMLRAEGFICDTTDLGEDGLEIGKLYDYDIIILDLMLPDIDGYEVLRRLRAARVRTPILILSGLGELDHKIKDLRLRHHHSRSHAARHRRLRGSAPPARGARAHADTHPLRSRRARSQDQ